jgi:hypothetical protein
MTHKIIEQACTFSNFIMDMLVSLMILENCLWSKGVHSLAVKGRKTDNKTKALILAQISLVSGKDFVFLKSKQKVLTACI